MFLGLIMNLEIIAPIVAFSFSVISLYALIHILHTAFISEESVP